MTVVPTLTWTETHWSRSRMDGTCRLVAHETFSLD